MGPQGTHIALVFFSNQAQVVSDFTEFNKDNIRRKIDEARHPSISWQTFINKGLKAAEEQVFRTEFGMRPHVKKVFWDKKKLSIGVLGTHVCMFILICFSARVCSSNSLPKRRGTLNLNFLYGFLYSCICWGLILSVV